LLSEKDLKTIQKELTRYDTNREKVLKLSRESIRLTGRSITYIHRFKYDMAERHLKQANERIKKAKSLVEGQPWLPAYKNLLTAYQELAEAKILYKFATKEELPSLKEVGVDVEPYLLGLLDFTGELRRMSLTMLLRGDVQKAERAMKVMEGIFDDLSMLNNTSLMSSFRHKLDTARRVVESTRGDIVTEVRRWNLENAINRLEGKINPSKRRTS
jgi:predicted translin family RNA/ssDNA-binding protein